MIERRKSQISGWGVYATATIPKNTRVIDYAGEKITHQESLTRERKYLKKGRIWCFTLNRRWVIDAGVGGTVADTVGRLMKQLGRERQVLAVTHLPQVAACADHHFVVSKRTQAGSTRSDVNAVRGEDSFVRAQWAGRPFLWHIYRQEEDIHLDKLDAFLELYVKGLSDPAREAISGLWRAWNAGEKMPDHWQSTRKHWPELEKHAEAWCLEQALQADLATALVQFYGNWI